jgi:hypothetical protein
MAFLLARCIVQIQEYLLRQHGIESSRGCRLHDQTRSKLSAASGRRTRIRAGPFYGCPARGQMVDMRDRGQECFTMRKSVIALAGWCSVLKQRVRAQPEFRTPSSVGRSISETALITCSKGAYRTGSSAAIALKHVAAREHIITEALTRPNSRFLASNRHRGKNGKSTAAGPLNRLCSAQDHKRVLIRPGVESLARILLAFLLAWVQ